MKVFHLTLESEWNCVDGYSVEADSLQDALDKVASWDSDDIYPLPEQFSCLKHTVLDINEVN